jgi:uncharacterized protein YqiB (DUF1249 family)
MTLYEANYIKFSHLVPELSGRRGSAISVSQFDCDLHLTIEHKTKYTCEVRLTYLFTEDESRHVADPDLIARIYFDARMAEVRSWIDNHKHAVLKSLRGEYAGELDERWNRNIMLSKWLEYLHDRGHYFPATSAVSC